MCMLMCMCISTYANKQVSKIGGNKEIEQTFRVYLNFELIANESRCVNSLADHFCISFFLNRFGDPLARNEKGRLLSSNLQHIFNKKHKCMF